METLETYRAIFESNQIAMVITDDNGKIVLQNEQAEELFGYSNDELLGKGTELLVPDRYSDVYVEQKRDFFSAPALRMAGTRKDFWVKSKDGTEFTVDISLNPIRINDTMYVIATIREVTEKLKQEHQLHASETRYRHTLDKMLEGVQIIGFDWRYLYVNDSFVQHSKHSREKLLSHTVLEMYPGIENTEIYSVYQRCFNERIAIQLENEFKFPDNSVGWFELSFQPVPEGVFILSIDITERKRTEIKLSAQNKMLQSMNEELGQFAYIASHDLQEPLRTLTSFAELIQEEYRDRMDENCSKYLGFILKSSNRMKQLIEGLLHYSRIGKERILASVDCNEIVNDVIADLNKVIIENNAEIIVMDLPVVKGYPVELRLLFQNLISNAIKFRKKDTIPKISISAEKKKNVWQFAVSDNGIGIDRENRDKIFILFKRLHNVNEYEGTGIGLSYCKKIVEIHHGSIWVESEKNVGSTFYFTIENFEDMFL